MRGRDDKPAEVPGKAAKREISTRLVLDELVSEFSPNQLDLTLNRVVASEPRPNVIVIGETGTGKSTLARFLHDKREAQASIAETPEGSEESTLPYHQVSMAAVPENLAESTLFGHVKGAFTGAIRDHVGALQAVKGGTLFLDEIHHAPKAVQAKLLVALESRKFQRVGGNKWLKLDAGAWIISATTTRKDVLDELFHRLGQCALTLNPLRMRRNAIPCFAKRTAERVTKGWEVGGLQDRAIDWLSCQNWPGNIREMDALIETAAYVADRNKGISKEDLERAQRLRGFEGEKAVPAPSPENVRTAFRSLLEGAREDDLPTWGELQAIAAHAYLQRFRSNTPAMRALGSRDVRSFARWLKKADANGVRFAGQVEPTRAERGPRTRDGG